MLDRLLPAADVAAKFHSLGGGSLHSNGWAFGCEFGFYQRDVGVNPIGLLRWASIEAAALLQGLQTGFEDLEDPAGLTLHGAETAQWRVVQNRYRMRLDHTALDPRLVPEDKARIRMARTLGRLRDMLLDELRNPTRLFVYRTYDHTISAEMMQALADAVHAYGGGTLCYVVKADDRCDFLAERLSPALILGLIDRFAPQQGKLIYNTDGWTAVCRSMLAVA